MSSLGNWFASLANEVTQIPIAFVNGVMSIFIPDKEFIVGKVEYLTEQFKTLGIGSLDMSAMFKGEKPIDDIKVNMYGQSITIVRMDIVNSALRKFRSVIRGFIGLLLILYNYNQFMALIGQPGITFGAHIKTLHSDRIEDKGV